MDKRKKKGTEPDKNETFLAAFAELEKRGITRESLVEALEAALESAYHRNFASAQNVRVALNQETLSYHVYAIKTVVEEVTNAVTEISLEDARALTLDRAAQEGKSAEDAQQEADAIEVDSLIEQEVTPANFGRIAAQAAKGVVVQRIREAERGNIYDEFTSRFNDIVTGIVQRVEPVSPSRQGATDGVDASRKQYNIYIDLGKTEAVLTAKEQIEGEEYRHGDRIKAFVLEVRKTTKGLQIPVSRTHPGLLTRLFELEVPEIQDGIVEIRSVAREPGQRSKIAVYSLDPEVDAVGACVGHKGLRVQAIVDELRDEKIDIVKWTDQPATYIANALSPAKVVSVAVNEAEKTSRVVVPDDQLSLAIGKEGQNARLAAKLTGWKIDIKSEMQAANEAVPENMNVVDVTDEETSAADGEY